MCSSDLHVLLILHFVGLILGTSVSVGSIVMAGLIGRATPEERPVLGRFMPAISKVGRAGLLLRDRGYAETAPVAGHFRMDERDGLLLDPKALERELGVPVIPTVAVRKRGLDELKARLAALVKEGHAPRALPGDHPAHHHEDIAALQRRARAL